MPDADEEEIEPTVEPKVEPKVDQKAGSIAEVVKYLREYYMKFPLTKRRQMVQNTFPLKERGSLMLCTNCMNVRQKKEGDPCTPIYSYPITKKSITEWMENQKVSRSRQNKGWKSYLSDEENSARMSKIKTEQLSE